MLNSSLMKMYLFVFHFVSEFRIWSAQGEEKKSATLLWAKILLCRVPSFIMRQIFYGHISKPCITEIIIKMFQGSTSIAGLVSLLCGI